MIVNAFTRAPPPLDVELMDYLSDVVVQLPISAYEAQNVALILNAYVKAERVKPALFGYAVLRGVGGFQ